MPYIRNQNKQYIVHIYGLKEVTISEEKIQETYIYYHNVIPVVIMADLIAAGDQEGWTVFTKAAIPVTWGQDIEVPETMLYIMFPLAGDHAARMFNPGAVTSGYAAWESKLEIVSKLNSVKWYLVKSQKRIFLSFTLY